jgi:hypothetical protein
MLYQSVDRYSEQRPESVDREHGLTEASAIVAIGQKQRIYETGREVKQLFPATAFYLSAQQRPG